MTYYLLFLVNYFQGVSGNIGTPGQKGEVGYPGPYVSIFNLVVDATIAEYDYLGFTVYSTLQYITVQRGLLLASLRRFRTTMLSS